MTSYGYHGTVLHIDLTQRAAWVEQPGEIFWRTYGGGGLLAAHYLWDDQGVPLFETLLDHRIEEHAGR